MEILNLLYNTPIREEVVRKAIEQRALIDQKVERTAELKSLIPQLETLYELRMKETGGERVTKLSTELEELLWKISGKDVGKQLGGARAGDLGRGRRSGRGADDQISLGHIQPGFEKARDDADQPGIACGSAATEDQRPPNGGRR
jgi:hypothetical protein